ncbi:hypothetical protein Y900_030875 [Mycolicibacterium aromaticivorans JS19b1 = JCM 16368]|uniref:Uncharacterized protein n=1 Tax=Mycolicibacterium aromaticivorans JS19b1 = JCM 16368 TaxID=1440774 RepID=A0A064CDC9_9MYCO|nr:hypothetical protein Y900_030875 [Mycolicibacterium aromaticivorans JS19b1 = JCM 16368]
MSVNVVAGLIGSAIIAALGLLGHRWHLIVERCNGSNAAAAFELLWFLIWFAIGLALAIGVITTLTAGEAGDGSDVLWYGSWGLLFLVYGGWNLWVIFTDPHGSPWITKLFRAIMWF